jgi:hypothetical protein
MKLTGLTNGMTAGYLTEVRKYAGKPPAAKLIS